MPFRQRSRLDAAPVTAVHQFVPVFAARSAIGNHVEEVARTLGAAGLTGDIWVTSAPRADRRRVRDWHQYPGRVQGEPTWILYQLSTGSPMADYLRQREEPTLINYHNVTPPSMLYPWEPALVPTLVDGRRQLGELAGGAALGIAVSQFNGAELVEAGYRRLAVVPVLVDFEALGAPRDLGLERRLDAGKRDGGVDWLFVGRLSPNKCQHQIVKALWVYRRWYDPKARLWLVGGSTSPRYAAALQQFVDALGLSDAVTLTGSVPQAALVSYYRRADVFVCLSEHEGFCVPLLEAMWHRVPVVALGATAVPETLGAAGLLLPFVAPGQGQVMPGARPGSGQPGPGVVAAAVRAVVGDGALRDSLVARGVERIEQFSLDRTRRLFTDVICNALEPTG
jgi:glycosyltransferase involved in cell wall biosynthesis